MKVIGILVFNDVPRHEDVELTNCMEQSASKVKVKLSLCLAKHHAMKAYGGVEV
jgi:hypothetical protein